MRRLVLLVVILIAVVAVFGGLLLGGDALAVHLIDGQVASHIEQKVPGSHAKVTISSQPFLVHLAASGTVEHLDAKVTNVTIDRYHVSSVDVKATGVKVNRGDLFRGKVRLDSIKTGTITATLSESDLLKAGLVTGLKSFSGSTASVSAGTSSVKISVDGFNFTLPYSNLVPCVGSASVEGSKLVLTCVTHQVPPALSASK